MCEDISIADDFDAWLGVVSGGVSLLIRPTETNPTLPDIFQMHHSIPVSKVACGMISQKEPLIQQYLTFKRLLYLKYRYLMRRLWLLNLVLNCIWRVSIWIHEIFFAWRVSISIFFIIWMIEYFYLKNEYI